MTENSFVAEVTFKCGDYSLFFMHADDDEQHFN